MGTLERFLAVVRRDPWPWALGVLALCLYLPGFTWGIPHPTGPDFTHAWGNDDLVPLAPLAEMHNTFVEAKPDRNIAYPWFHYFLLACAYGPYLAYLWLSGGLVNPTGVYPFGLTDPVTAFWYLSIIGRSVSILLALALVAGAYHAGRYLWGTTAGVFSGLFSMMMFPMTYYARLGNPDVPVLAWTSLGLAVSAAILRYGLTVRRAVWLGVFVALALATKDQAFGSFVLLVPTMLAAHCLARRSDRERGWREMLQAPAAASAAFLGTYVVASGIPVDPVRFWQHVSATAVTGTQGTYLRYPATVAGMTAQFGDLMGYLVDVMSWPVLIAAAIGLVLAVRHDRKALILVLSALGFLLILMPVRFSRVHYLLPVALPLNLFAGYTFAVGLKSRPAIKIGTQVAACLAGGLLLVQTLDLNHDMRFDSRYAASAWLHEHMQPKDRLLYFGAGLRIPPLRRDIETRAVTFRDQAEDTLRRERPEFVLVMPQDFNENRERVEWRYGRHSIHSDYLPAHVFDKLVDGSLDYRLVAQFQTPRLFPWLNRPFLTYSTVNPPIHIFVREDRRKGAPVLDPWPTAPHYPTFVRVRELTIDYLRASKAAGGDHRP